MSKVYTFTSSPDVALTPPPGVIPDFQDPFTVRPYWLVTASVGMILTGVTLGLRMYTKIAIVKKCRWEDCKFCGRFLRSTTHAYWLIDTCCLAFVSIALWMRCRNDV